MKVKTYTRQFPMLKENFMLSGQSDVVPLLFFFFQNCFPVDNTPWFPKHKNEPPVALIAAALMQNDKWKRKMFQYRSVLATFLLH